MVISAQAGRVAAFMGISVAVLAALATRPLWAVSDLLARAQASILGTLLEMLGHHVLVNESSIYSTKIALRITPVDSMCYLMAPLIAFSLTWTCRLKVRAILVIGVPFTVLLLGVLRGMSICVTMTHSRATAVLVGDYVWPGILLLVLYFLWLAWWAPAQESRNGIGDVHAKGHDVVAKSPSGSIS